MTRQELDRQLEEDGIAVCPACRGNRLDPDEVMAEAGILALENWTPTPGLSQDDYNDEMSEMLDENWEHYVQYLDAEDIPCPCCRGTGRVDWISISRDIDVVSSYLQK
jgi:hypothetical protein